MNKGYSPEFKQAILDEYLAGGISMRKLAKKHEVSKSLVYNLVRARRRAKGMQEHLDYMAEQEKKRTGRHLWLFKG